MVYIYIYINHLSIYTWGNCACFNVDVLDMMVKHGRRLFGKLNQNWIYLFKQNNRVESQFLTSSKRCWWSVGSGMSLIYYEDYPITCACEENILILPQIPGYFCYWCCWCCCWCWCCSSSSFSASSCCCCCCCCSCCLVVLVVLLFLFLFLFSLLFLFLFLVVVVLLVVAFVALQHRPHFHLREAYIW